MLRCYPTPLSLLKERADHNDTTSVAVFVNPATVTSVSPYDGPLTASSLSVVETVSGLTFYADGFPVDVARRVQGYLRERA